MLGFIGESSDPLALRDGGIVEMLLATGLRVSELAEVRIDDVDLGEASRRKWFDPRRPNKNSE